MYLVDTNVISEARKGAQANPGVTAQECLDTFDRNSDGDVDLQDFADFQRRVGA